MDFFKPAQEEKKEKSPDYIYIQSESLGMEIAVSKKTGAIWTEDGVYYKKEEVKRLSEHNAPIPEIVHFLKREFKGEIVK